MENYIEQEYLNSPTGTYSENSFEIGTGTVKTDIINFCCEKVRENPVFGHIAEHRLFNEKNGEIFLKFATFLEKVIFRTNDSIYQPGDKIDYVYFPQSSVFSEFQILDDGATVEIAMTGSEGIVGLASIFDNSPATTWTQVSAAGNALRIKSKILREEISFNRNLQRILYACLGSYIKQISQRSVCNNWHPLEKRLCSWLLMMEDRLKNRRLPMTHERMAQILGANRPTITYIAHSLRGAGIIDYCRGSLFIRNRTELKNRACGCYEEINKKLENGF